MENTSPLSTIFAGEELKVTFLDGSVATIRIRQMPLRHMQEVLGVIDDEGKLLDKVCVHVPGSPALPEGWVDALTDDSFIALVEKARAQNFSRAVAWAQRAAAQAEALAPLAPLAKRAKSLLN